MSESAAHKLGPEVGEAAAAAADRIPATSGPSAASRPRLWLSRQCYPHSWAYYWRPRRITASFRDRHVYRWFVLNVAPKGLPR